MRHFILLIRRPYIIISAFVLILIFLPGLSKRQELLERKQFLEAETKRLYNKNKTLMDEAERLQRDPHYQEKIAREKLGYVKEGEIVLQMEPQE
ncbi:MAG: septum formation initiator family protein [Candidatus Omnitrophota bacterium]